MKRILIALFAFVLVGCSTQFSTLRPEGSTSQVIYAISEEQAFQIGFASLASILPGYEITDIDGPIKGYSAVFRFVLDTYTQQVMVIPATGKDATGKFIRGYYFDVSGRGSSILQGRAKNVELYELVFSSAQSTGKAVVVSDVTTNSYSGTRWKQGEISSKNAGAVNKSIPKDDALSQIERLKQMRDRNVITDTEFETKKKELLDRI